MKRRILYGAAGLLAIGNWVCDFFVQLYIHLKRWPLNLVLKICLNTLVLIF